MANRGLISCIVVSWYNSRNITLSTHRHKFMLLFFLLLICKPDHNDRQEDIADYYLRRIGSLHLRNNSHRIVLCLFHVSNRTILH